MLTTLLLAALLGCHVSSVVPIVTDWTVTTGPGTIVVDARLAMRDPIEAPYPPSQYYFGERSHWVLGIYFRPLGSTDPAERIETRGASVTDSTLHFDGAVSPGAYQVYTYIDGSDPGETDTCSPYSRTDTLTVLPDPSAAVRASFGQVKARWR